MDFGEERICRLCLKKLTENCEPIEEIVQYTLNFLTLCPNLTISDDPMMCETCAVNLKKCFDFKTRCLDTEDWITSFSDSTDKKADLQDLYAKIKLEGNIAKVPAGHRVCRFCLELVNDDVSKSVRHDADVIRILQKYFLEMDLEITDNIIACTRCYNSLQFHVRFVNNHISMERKLNEYYNVEGANYKGQLDLKYVATFTSKSVLNIENISNPIIKKEEHKNTADTDVDIEIKLEEPRHVKQENEEVVNKEIQHSNNNSFQHQLSSSQSDHEPQLTRVKPAQYTCHICGYQNNSTDLLQEHILTHKDSVLIERYNCEFCPFKTKSKYYISKHMLKCKHRNTSDEITQTMYKCSLCDYEAKWKCHVKRHVLTHKTPLETTMYKCYLCEWETKYKASLKAHILTHETVSETTMYKCETCSYETKQRQYLRRHLLLSHRNNPDVATQVTVYKCYLCDYKTTRNANLKKHTLTHQTPSENTMYECEAKCKDYPQKHTTIDMDVSEIEMHKCKVCTFETKRKKNLLKHLLSHRVTADEVARNVMYKCVLCGYETKLKWNLKNHMQVHKTPSEVTMYKCNLCVYETIIKSNLKRHVQTHKTPPEVTKYNCDLCEYKTKRKTFLKKHVLTHKTPWAITMYKCDLCDYETVRKGSLTRHTLTHQTPSVMTVYKCDLCEYETKWRSNLKNHVLTHESTSGVTVYKCDLCEYETKLKTYLKKHVLTHKRQNIRSICRSASLRQSEVQMVKEPSKTSAFSNISTPDELI